MAALENIVSRNLQCPVCLELLSDPKQLSCAHTFCKKCLNDILMCSTHNSITCPICRDNTTVKDGDVENLKTNILIRSLVDDLKNSKQLCEVCDSNKKATHFCCDCGKNMCKACLESHNKWPSNLNHKIVSVEDLREGRVVLEKEVYCPEHPSERKKRICTDVCITCKKFICERCRIIKHKGHTVQDAEEYKDSIKTEIKSLQIRGNRKAKTVKNHQTCIGGQKNRVTAHLDGKKAEINKIYQESLRKLNERKAVLDKQIETQKEQLCKRFGEMNNADERFVASIESAIELAVNSLKAPLDDDAIRIHNSLSIELKNLLSKKDPLKKLAIDVTDCAEQIRILPNKHLDELDIGEVMLRSCKLVTFIIWMSIVTLILSVLLMNYCSLSDGLSNVLDKEDPKEKLATDVADHVEQLIFTQNNKHDQLNIGEVKFVKCVLKCDVALSKKGRMKSMTPTPDGRMAVGYYTGEIDIFTADGQLQQTVLTDMYISGIGFLSNGQYVVLDNDLTLYTQGQVKLNVKFETLSEDEGGISNLAVDSNDLIYVSYTKAQKIQVFSPAGGKAIREIPCNGYEPWQITSYKDSIISSDLLTIRVIDKEGNVKHRVDKPGLRAFAAVTQNDSILIAWVNRDDGLVSIDEYTNELKHIKTLISDQKIQPEKWWYYLQEFRSGEIAFCAADRLYIFKLTITSISV